MKEIQSTKPKITRRDSFVIRIWQEEGKPGWKGWVQHARSGESSLIRDLGDLLAFIERRLGKLDTTARKGLK
jgi:hypothetical protein